MGNKKTNIKTTPFLPPFPRLNFSPSVPTPLPHSGARRWGMGTHEQFITVPLCWAFLLTLSPCSSVGPFHRLLSFRIILLLLGSFIAHSSSRVVAWGSPRAAVRVSAPAWLSPGAAGESLLGCLEYLLSLILLWLWCLQGCFSHIFCLTHLTQSCHTVFLLLLTYVFPEVPPASLWGSAVPCGGLHSCASSSSPYVLRDMVKSHWGRNPKAEEVCYQQMSGVATPWWGPKRGAESAHIPKTSAITSATIVR